MEDDNNPKWGFDPWIPMSKPIDLKHLSKLIEELGEAASAAARCLAQGIDQSEPVTGKVNRDWLTEELADVQANMVLVVEHFGLDRSVINLRSLKKMTNLRRWHEMLDHIPYKDA